MISQTKAIRFSLLVIFLAFLGFNFIYPRFLNQLINKINNSFPKINEFQKNSFDKVILDFKPLPQIKEQFSLGLDLVGGTLLIYEADLKEIKPVDYHSAMSGLRDVIERRINIFGVREPRVMINKAGESWRLIVELAGIKDIKEAIKMIGETPYLEFREARSETEREEILKKQEEEKKKENPDQLILFTDPYFQATPLTGRYLKKAMADFDSLTNLPVVNLQFDEEGTKIFAALTKKNIGKPLAIYLDGLPLSIPVVKEEITGGIAQISGEFTLKEVRQLAQRLNQGALPVPINLISQQSIGAILGEEFLEKTIFAGGIGFILIILFLLIIYGLYGLAGSLALVIYLIFSLVIFKSLPITLSLAGIVGFILSLGMAVDANILIFEHIREEIKRGRKKEIAVSEGFQMAWPAIRDSNVSTILSVIILFYFTTGMIQGFALTLGIGVTLSMVSAILITSLFLRCFIR